MKRYLSICLVVMLLCLSASALGDVSVTAVSWPESMMNAKLYLTEDAAAFYNINGGQAGVSEAGAFGMMIPVSMSPTGDSALAFANGVLFSVRAEGIYMLAPSSTRGVQDTYKKLERRLRSAKSLISEDQVVWSPDGRYALITDWKQCMLNAKLIVDPAVIDTMTGEIVLLASYGEKIRDGAAALVAACFSQDSEYLYYTLYGSIYEDKSSLMCCRLATGEVTYCTGLDGENSFVDRPDLKELNDGSLLSILEGRKVSDPAALAIICRSGDSWSMQPLDMGYTQQYWMPRMITYSRQANIAVVTGAINTLMSDANCGFAVIANPRNAWGMSYWTILEDGTLHRMTDKEMTTVNPSNNQYDASIHGQVDVDTLYAAAILSTCMSPDGSRLLVYYYSRADQKAHMSLIDLNTMTAEEVQGLPDFGLNAYEIVKETQVEWNYGSTILWTHTGVSGMLLELQ